MTRLGCLVSWFVLVSCAGSSTPQDTTSACAAVVARVSAGGTVPIQGAIDISAAASTSSDGSALTFQWFMNQKPERSQAVLTAGAGPTTSFLADQIGSYTVTVVVTGSCSSSTSVTYVAADQEPTISFLSSAGAAPGFVGVPITVEAAASDPDGDALTISLVMTSAPFESQVRFDSHGALEGQFTPDVPGLYQFAATATDGFIQKSASGAVSVTSHTLSSTLPKALFANAGRPVTLDAAGSSAQPAAPLTLDWQIDGNPSTAAGTMQRTFLPTVPGTYRTLATLSDGTATYGAVIPLTVYPALQTMSYQFTDAQFSRALNRIFFLDTSSEVRMHDPFTGDDSVIAEGVASFALSPDGLAAAIVRPDAIALYDLQGTPAQISSWPVPVNSVQGIGITDPLPAAGGGTTRYALWGTLVDTFRDRVRVLDLDSGVLDGGGDPPQDAPGFSTGELVRALKGSTQFLTGGTGGLELELFRSDGAHGVQGSNALCRSGFWASEDGTQIICGTGVRVRLPDFTVDGVALVLGEQSWWADATAASGKWLVQPRNCCSEQDPVLDTSFNQFDVQTLGDRAVIPLPQLGLGARAAPLHGRLIAYDKTGTRRISAALVQDSQLGTFAAVTVF